MPPLHSERKGSMALKNYRSRWGGQWWLELTLRTQPEQSLQRSTRRGLMILTKNVFKERTACNVKVYSEKQHFFEYPNLKPFIWKILKAYHLKCPKVFVPTSIIPKFCQWFKVKVSKYQLIKTGRKMGLLMNVARTIRNYMQISRSENNKKYMQIHRSR